MRLDVEADFSMEIEEDLELRNIVSNITMLQEETNNEIAMHIERNWMPYSDLWKMSKEEYFQNFLTKVEAEMEVAKANSTGKVSGLTEQVFMLYAAEIGMMAKRIQSLGQLKSAVPLGYAVMIMQPLKQTLLDEVSKWKYDFISNLSDRLEEDIHGMQSFINDTTAGIAAEVPPTDRAALHSTMQCLFQVRERAESAPALFKNVANIVELLHRYDVPIEPEVVRVGEALPVEWEKLKEACESCQLKLYTMQAEEAEIIQAEEDALLEQLQLLEDNFTSKAPFILAIGPQQAYEMLQATHEELLLYEGQAKAITAAEKVFELQVNDFRRLSTSREKLVQLKEVWDVVSLILYQMEHWKKTVWGKIKSSEIEVAARAFMKEIRSLDRRVRSWDVFVELEKLLKEFMVVMPMEELDLWQTRLSEVDGAMNIWFDVQKTWSYLEPIFVGSKDIRKQLPEECKRFDGIDADLRELMKDVETTPNVVECCTRDGLLDTLESLNEGLSVCEKVAFVHASCDCTGTAEQWLRRLQTTVSQLEELLHVRHCVFIIGPSKSAKTKEREILQALFDQFLPQSLDKLRSKDFELIIPSSDISLVQTVVALLEGLLKPSNGSSYDLYEIYFVFAVVWGLCSSLVQDGNSPSLRRFSTWWRNTFKGVTTRKATFPDTDLIFDYYIAQVNPAEKVTFVPWPKETYQHDSSVPFAATHIPIREHTRLAYLTDILAREGHGVLLVGVAGCGKTMLVQKMLAALPSDFYMSVYIALNYYTTSMSLQAGSFTVNPRLQGQFAVLAMALPAAATLTGIYTKLVQGHLKEKKWKSEVLSFLPSVVAGAVELLERVTKDLMPTATKFHYNFNMRDLARTFQLLHDAAKRVVIMHMDKVHVDDVVDTVPIYAATGEMDGGDDDMVYEEVPSMTQLQKILQENAWAVFLGKVRSNLKVVLCHSPVGDALRVRCRQFPALLAHSCVDWFFPWPLDGLRSVCVRSLQDLDLETPEMSNLVADFMAFAHTSVRDSTGQYRLGTRRFVYITPKSALEFIAFYK
eukprot:gene11343-13405_t